MKKFIITNLAVFSLSLGAVGQGTIDFNNTGVTNPNSAVFLGFLRNYYTGPISMELWIKNGAPDPSVNTINSTSGTNAFRAYPLLAANGWIKEATTPSTLSAAVNGGQFGFGTVTLPDVSPAGATINFAMAAWFGGSSFTSGLNSGVLALQNVLTGNPGASPPGTPGDINEPWDKMNVGLILNWVPEPGVFALVGSGAALLLVFRRRK